MSTVRVLGPLTRLARRHGLTRSPLCRSTDRVEVAVTAGAVVLALLAVLLATIIALGSYQRARTEGATKAAHQSSMTAVLLTDAAVQRANSPEHGVAGEPTALARWQLPNGQQRTAPIWVSADRHAGDRIAIWIDQHGNRVDSPETPWSMIADAVAYGVVLLAGGWVMRPGPVGTRRVPRAALWSCRRRGCPVQY
ncbi:MAG: hypothetical protein ABR528_10515 [Pseudonocardiaceae bacterium]